MTCRRVLVVVAVALLASLSSQAASIPAWLDQAITDFNKANATRPVEFVEIKNSFVWYRVAKDGSADSVKGRKLLYTIAESTGYATTSPEELVITARPPAASGPDKDKKCWSRSFTKDVTTGQQRLLSSLICEDGENWMLGFRVIQ